jgi:hypothetical protein
MTIKFAIIVFKGCGCEDIEDLMTRDDDDAYVTHPTFLMIIIEK